MDPVSLAVGTVASCVVTELIKRVISCTQLAVKCKSECKKLHEELVVIMPDVEKIEMRLALLRKANRCDVREDLQMVDDWLRRLKNAIESAKADVHRCNSGRFSFDQPKLSERLTSQYNTIMNLGHQRQTLFLLLGRLKHVPAQVASQVPPQETLHPPHDWYDSPGASVLRRMADERNDALRREELYRQSMSPGSSFHNGWGSGHGGYDSNESSSHGGFWSEADSSGHGGDSPAAHLLRHRTQQRDAVFQRDEQHRSQSETERQLLRRHTMAGTQALASAYGHDPEPAYDKWKY